MTAGPKGFLSSLFGLIFWVALSFAPGWFGSRFPPGEWYAHLNKASFTPPDWAFAPVWGLLYLLMGLAAWLVWHRQGVSQAFPALVLFIVQLALNAGWSWIFFGLHRPGMALADLLVLWLAILGTLVAFGRYRPVAGLLLLPYFLWVSFAALLNYQFWRLNP